MSVAEQPQESHFKRRQRAQLVVSRKARAVADAQALPSEPHQVHSFLHEIGRRINSFQEMSISGRSLAFEVIEIIEQLVRLETRLLSIRFGMDIFFEKLHTDATLSKLVTDLYRWARLTISQGKTTPSALRLSEEQVIEKLNLFFNWYLSRRETLKRLVSSEEHSFALDQILPPTLVHDREAMGVLGLEIHSGLAIFGRAHQQLWLKVTLQTNGELVKARKGWSSWVDDSEMGSSDTSENTLPFAALVPVYPQTQRVLIDNFSVFIPYGALELGIGRQEVGIYLSLYDESGDLVTQRHLPDTLCVPPFGNGARRIVSYQALGIWPCDIARGDQIFNLQVKSSIAAQAKSALEVIRASFDLNLYAHSGERIFVELRFLHPDGSIVEKKESSGRRDFLYREELYIPRPLYSACDHEISVALSDLNLEDAPDALMAEVTVLGGSEKVLCGAVSAFDLPRHLRQQSAFAERETPSALQATASINRDVVVDVEQARIPLGTDALRFSLKVESGEIMSCRGTAAIFVKQRDLFDSDAPVPQFRLLSARRLPRTLSLAGSELAFLVTSSQLCSALGVSSRPSDFEWKISILAMDDTLMSESYGIASIQNDMAHGIEYRTLPMPKSSITDVNSQICIDDIHANDIRDIVPLRFTVRIGFSHHAFEASQYMLQITALTSSRKGKSAFLRRTWGEVGGFVLPIDLSLAIDYDGRRSDWYQSVHHVDCKDLFKSLNIDPRKSILRARIFSSHGVALDTRDFII